MLRAPMKSGLETTRASAAQGTSMLMTAATLVQSTMGDVGAQTQATYVPSPRPRVLPAALATQLRT